jgi:hypothetical protein
MKGFITTRDVLLHPALIVRSFGLRVYGRCLLRITCSRGRASTFLECIGMR